MNKACRFAKIIRVVTVVPVTALTTLSILYELYPNIFQGTSQFILTIVFLSVLPLSAYPLQPILPKYRNKGREGQRNLALMMGVLGYLFGIVFALCSHATRELLVIYLIYFLSGIGILFFNKILKIHASGHACGVAVPILILVNFIGIKALVGVGVLVMVYWASIKTKRHTISQLLLGSIIAVFALIISKFCVS